MTGRTPSTFFRIETQRWTNDVDIRWIKQVRGCLRVQRGQRLFHCSTRSFINGYNKLRGGCSIEDFAGDSPGTNDTRVTGCISASEDTIKELLF